MKRRVEKKEEMVLVAIAIRENRVAAQVRRTTGVREPHKTTGEKKKKEREKKNGQGKRKREKREKEKRESRREKRAWSGWSTRAGL